MNSGRIRDSIVLERFSWRMVIAKIRESLVLEEQSIVCDVFYIESLILL